jgi:Major Facilitator Superfamily
VAFRIGLPPSFSVLGETDFRPLLLGTSISSLGDKLVPVALAFAVLELDASPAALGFVLAAAMVPMVALLVIGGVWGDRLPRRRVMIACDVVRAAAQALSAIILVAGVAQVWELAALQAVYGAATAFFTPASQGLVQEAVAEPFLQQANAFLGISRNVAGVAGPALAAAIVASIGAGWALAADAGSFLASAAFLLRMGTAGRRSPSATTAFLTDLRVGWREFRTRSWVWASVCHFGLFHLLVWAPLLVLGPVVAKTSLGGASAWAAILAAGSAGAIAGGVVAVRLRPGRPLVVVFGLMLLFAPQLVLLALGVPTLLIAGAALLAQAGMSALNITWFATLQARVPAEALARVTSYDWFGSALLLPLGLLLVGPLAATFGTQAILVGAAVWAVASSASMLALPAINGFRSGARGADVSVATEAFATG